jgi:hypothetical protein
MESQRELVAAAEALKTWVINQRTARMLESGGMSAPASLPTTDSAAPAPATWTAQSAPIVFPTMPSAQTADAFAPPLSEPLPSPPFRANTRWAKGLGAILPQFTPRLADVGRTTLKVAGVALVLAAIGGGAMVAKLKWDDYAAARRIGTATFASVPSGAQVFVDGQPVGTTPVRVELQVGRHNVELQLKGAKRTQSLEVVHGQDVGVAIDWKAKPVGGLQAASVPPGAKVIIDGRTRGVTPLTLHDIVAGQHTVVLETALGSVRRQITVSEGRTETLSESIYAGWLHVSAPIDVVLFEGVKPLQLDTSNRVLLRPGVHEITAQNRELGFNLTQSVEIEPGATATLDIDTQYSSLTVKGPDGATVFVDAEKVGETPLVNHPVKIGSRDIKVVDPSGATYHLTVNVTRAPAQVNVDFPKP